MQWEDFLWMGVVPLKKRRRKKIKRCKILGVRPRSPSSRSIRVRQSASIAKSRAIERKTVLNTKETTDDIFLSCPFTKLVWEQLIFDSSFYPSLPQTVIHIWTSWRGELAEETIGWHGLLVFGNFLVFMEKKSSRVFELYATSPSTFFQKTSISSSAMGNPR